MIAMANTYKAISAVGEHYFGAGVSDLDLSPTEEQDALTGGHLEIVPRKYRVLSDNYSAGPQGSEFEAAYPVEHEQALMQGGHIARVDVAVTKGGSTKKTAASAGDEKKED